MPFENPIRWASGRPRKSEFPNGRRGKTQRSTEGEAALRMAKQVGMQMPVHVRHAGSTKSQAPALLQAFV